MSLKIISLNVNSIISFEKKFLLNNFIYQNPVDIYLLQETKLKESLSFHYNGYNFFKADNRIGCGGVAIIIRNDLKIKNFKKFMKGGIEMISIDTQIGN